MLKGPLGYYESTSDRTSDDFHYALAFRRRFEALRLGGVQCKDTFRQTGGSEPARRLSTRTTPQGHAGVLQEYLPAGRIAQGEFLRRGSDTSASDELPW